MPINKKCPPGVFCIENMTMGFIVILFIFVVYLIYVSFVKSKHVNVNNNNRIVIEDKKPSRAYESGFGFFQAPNYPYSNLPADVLLNPYVPPLRDERYLVPEINIVPPGRVPINISTNVGAVDTTYRQVGLLTPVTGYDKPNCRNKIKKFENETLNNNIIPLMGRPLFTNRNMWQYYTMSDQNNSVKLPIRFKGKNASNEYGVDKICNGDIVYVEGYQRAFRVTEYENDTIQYLPFL